MPLLFYGQVTTRQSKSVYLPGLSITKEHKWAKVQNVVPDEPEHCVAAFWQWVDKEYSILAWRQDFFVSDRIVLVPGLLKLQDAITLSREGFPDLIPSPMIFRADNERPWLYE